jgi:adenylate cyclase
VRIANAIAFALYMPFALGLGGIWTARLAAPMMRWLRTRRAPSGEEVDDVLRFPARQIRVDATFWGGAAILFGGLNAIWSLPLGVLIAITIALGGTTTCALVYLFAERLLRPMTARALVLGPPSRPVMPGVAARVLLAWGFSTAVPLAAGLALAISALAGSPVTLTRISVTIVFLVGAALLAGGAAMTIAARSLADPLHAVRDALAKVEHGNLDIEVEVDDGSEVGLLQAGFNRMVAGLREHERLRDLFGRHVGEEVAREAIERGVALGGEQRAAAALFVDLVGSTTLASERSPSEVVSLLNRFFALVVEVADAHGGWINKFEGDGALCVFGAPVALEDAAGCALATARELSERLERELPELPAAIGVSAGTVVAGNVGAANRFEYTVIGDPVNEAARLTELAKSRPGRVLASGAALDAASGEEGDCWTADGEATLRGRPEPTALAVPA